MAKKHNVKVNRGSFKLVGTVFGTKEPKRFFKNMVFESGSEKNQLTFGVKTSKINDSFVSLEGFTQKIARFNKYDNTTKTNLQQEVSWNTRFDFDEEGYTPSFGTKINLDGGEMVTLFQYDACEELRDSLVDGMSVYVEGDTKFVHYKKGDEVKRWKSLEVRKIYKQDKPINFDSADFTEKNLFMQEFIFMGIEQEMDFATNKPTGRAIVSGKVVTSESVEDVTFVIEDKKLISNMRSKLKPYYCIKATGRLISSVVEEDEVKADDDGWGAEEDFETKKHKSFKEWLITKVDPASIDKDTYSEAVLASVTQAEDDFGDFSTDDDDDVWE